MEDRQYYFWLGAEGDIPCTNMTPYAETVTGLAEAREGAFLRNQHEDEYRSTK